jgi:ubiquinone/menaquinone biosynthesis C-methylase UbiE
MLTQLAAKFPGAETYVTASHELRAAPDGACDVLVSNLALGYLPDLGAAMGEWCRVLRPGGQLLMTDLHPTVAAGGSRGFRQGAREVRIRHFVHPIESVMRAARRHALEPAGAEDGLVDDSLRPVYAAKNALDRFEATKGHSLVYGLRFRKT